MNFFVVRCATVVGGKFIGSSYPPISLAGYIAAIPSFLPLFRIPSLTWSDNASNLGFWNTISLAAHVWWEVGFFGVVHLRGPWPGLSMTRNIFSK